MLIAKSPERAPSLLSYTSTLAQFSKRYRFPLWLLYGLKFCGEAAESGRTDWSKVYGGLPLLLFYRAGSGRSEGVWGLPLLLFYRAGSGRSPRGVVLVCRSTTLRPRALFGLRTPPQWVRSVSFRPPASDHSREGPLRASILEPCQRGEPDCLFGDDCIYLHVCTACKGDHHPESRCPKQRPA